jgi:hypothetical protein
VDVKENVGVESLVGPDGPAVIDVLGTTVSTVTVRVFDAPDVFPAASVAFAV